MATGRPLSKDEQRRQEAEARVYYRQRTSEAVSEAPSAPAAPPRSTFYVLAKRDVNAAWRGRYRLVGPAGSIFEIAERDRGNALADGGFLRDFEVLDDVTAGELLAAQAALAEEYTRQAEAEAAAREAADRAEAERAARAEALRALALSAVPKPG